MISPRAILLAILAGLSKRRVAVAASCAAIVLFAGVALFRMPLQLLPEIRYPQIRIISDIPGQTSRVIEESVNEPIEAALAGIPGIVQLESRSGDGRSYLDLVFAPGYDLDRALRDVTQAVQRAQPQIPAGFPEPRIFAVSTTEQPALQIAVGSPSLTPAEIRQRLRTSLLPRLRAVTGVEAVYMGREEVPELVVEIDPVRQAAAGVSLEAVEATLLQATQPPPSSAMRTQDFEGLAVLGDNAWSPRRFEERHVPVAGTGHAVPLGAFARVRFTSSEESLRTRLDGESAVLVSVYRSTDGHSLRLSRDARAVIDELNGSEIFRALEAEILFDDSVVTRGAVRSVITAAISGAVLAMLLLVFGLGHRRYTPLVAVIVAVSLAASVILLAALGETLNLLTLAGLLLSVGLGLDYSIIYFDRLDRLGARGDRPHLEAMGDVIGPLLGALLTTIAAVVPFLLVRGPVALLFRPLIVTVIVAGIFCFLFAVVVLPVFVRLAPGTEPHTTPPAPAGGGRWRWLRGPSVIWGSTVVLAGILILGGGALPFEVLPVVDDGFVNVRVTHPAGITAAEMDRIARRVESRLAEVPGTDALFTTVGGYFREGLPAFRPGTADFMVRVDLEGAGTTSAAWAEGARAAFRELGQPGLSASITPPQIRGVRTRLADADLVVVLTREDGDLLTLGESEGQVVDLLRGIPGLLGVQRVRGGVSPRWVADPRYDLLAANGIEPVALNRAASYALAGTVIRQRMMNGEPLALRARYDRAGAGGPHQLQEARVPSRNGGDMRLGDLVDFRLIEEPTNIERREGQRVIRVAAQLDPAGPGAAAVERSVRQALLAGGLPAGVGWWLEGEIDALRETSRTFAISIVLALLLVLTLLIMQYGSVPLALAGLISIPLCAAGAILLLWVMSRPLDAMVLAGLLIAIGVVANNVILVLSHGQEAAEGPDALPLDEALVLAARDRLRPITLTVLSTVLGMSPLLLGGAEVFGLLQPLAIALVGTLLVSIPMAYFLLPGIAAAMVAAARRL
jgi:multidrug efflux pump subunit AcrB